VTAEPMVWTPACMEPDELARWQESDAAVQRTGGHSVVPCAECLPAFAAEMRAVGRCNGIPRGGAKEDEMDQPNASIVPLPPANPSLIGSSDGSSRGLTITRRVELEVTAPPCGSCAHEPICALRTALEGLATVETSASPLPAGLRLSLVATVECSHFLRDRAKAAPARVLTPQQRGQANGPGAHRLSPEARARVSAGNTARAEARRAAREGAAAG
jgi:hypothetical protein